MVTLSTASGIGAVAGVSILTALCADVATPESFRDGYALGAFVAAFGILSGFGLRSIDHDAPDHKETTLSGQGTSDVDDDGLATAR